MPRTTLSPITAPTGYGIVPTTVVWTAADVANGNQFRITGRTMLLARNSGATAHTITIASSNDPWGRTRDITSHSLAAGEFRVLQMFPVNGWVQPDGFLYANADHAEIQFAVIEVPYTGP